MPYSQPPSVSRRKFLSEAGDGLGASALATRALKAQRVPDPPGRRLGWAIGGRGSLAINQILPAFARCERSGVTALVSGDPDKARKLAARYGVPEKSLYTYATYESARERKPVRL